MKNLEIMENFTLKNIPDLDTCVLGALELFMKEPLPKINIKFKKPMVTVIWEVFPGVKTIGSVLAKVMSILYGRNGLPGIIFIKCLPDCAMHIYMAETKRR